MRGDLQTDARRSLTPHNKKGSTHHEILLLVLRSHRPVQPLPTLQQEDHQMKKNRIIIATLTMKEGQERNVFGPYTEDQVDRACNRITAHFVDELGMVHTGNVANMDDNTPTLHLLIDYIEEI